MKEIDIYEFKTYSGSEYVYFPDTNMVFGKDLINNKDRYEKIKNINGFQKDDNFYNYKDVDSNDVKENIYKYGLTELSIELTTQCNLRCKYCIYSGQYEGQRIHDSKTMSKDIAIKAIDMYIGYIKEGAKYNPNRKPVIAFYGGEPLLNYDLLKECVKHVKDIYDGEVLYAITTNGTLLNDEIIEFLVRENFNIIVSLDGYRENHDRNRVFADGRGTYDTVMSNINKLKDKQECPVLVNTVFDYKTDLVKLKEFFYKNPQVFELALNSVNPHNTDYYTKFDNKDYEAFNESINILKDEFISCVKSDYNNVQSFLSRVFGDICTSIFMKQSDLNMDNDKVIKTTGACVPGTKIFVDYKGDLYICEKVTRNITVGTVFEGLDLKKCASIVNQYNKTMVPICKKCILRNTCKRCYTSFSMDKGFEVNQEFCKNQIYNFKKDIEFAYSIFELNPTWIGTYFNEYYDTIKEVAVTLK